MKLSTTNYLEQSRSWPTSGAHILAHYDDESIVVYQAYRPSIGRYAVEHQRLGGPEFSFSRMSWIKPNFLWMMYRSGWGTKPDQEFTLGLRIKLTFFESLLEQAVASTFDEQVYHSHDAWRSKLSESNVRLQWDPDHSPTGSKLERRAIQLGLRGNALRKLAGDELLEVIDLSPFVEAQRGCVGTPDQARLCTPSERVYLPRSDLARLQTQVSM